MAKTPLANGMNVVVNQKIGAVNTPIYPFTRTANVKDVAGNTLDDIIATLALKSEAHYVPANEDEASNLRFLRNDNTWAEIQSASTTQKGVVQLSDATDLEDSTVAATAKAVKLVKDAVNALDTTVGADFVKKAQLGAATADGVTGVATLDAQGHVPAAQLPSYVDDVLEVKISEDLASATDAEGQAIEGETGKIYVDLDSNKTYRWSGNKYVVISETLALGETEATAFDGARGKVAYDHSQAAHARVDATKVEGSDNNGYIKVDGTEVLVYTHPAGTNPHGTTKADVGLAKVEDKTSEEIRAELTAENVTDALTFTPQNAAVKATAAGDGVMTATQAQKLDNCLEASVGSEVPSFANGIWFQVMSQD